MSAQTRRNRGNANPVVSDAASLRSYDTHSRTGGRYRRDNAAAAAPSGRSRIFSTGRRTLRHRLISALCCVGLWGPRARDLLSRVREDDISNAGFPYMTAKPISVADAPSLALRISYVGELGWEIYAPVEHGLALWDALWDT